MSAVVSVRTPKTMRSPGSSGPLETTLAAGEAAREAAGADAAAAGVAGGADEPGVEVAALLPQAATVIATIASAAASDPELRRDMGRHPSVMGGSPTGPVCAPLGPMTPADG